MISSNQRLNALLNECTYALFDVLQPPTFIPTAKQLYDIKMILQTFRLAAHHVPLKADLHLTAHRLSSLPSEPENPDPTAA